MTYLKIAGAVLTVLLAFGGGYRYAAALLLANVLESLVKLVLFFTGKA